MRRIPVAGRRIPFPNEGGNKNRKTKEAVMNKTIFSVALIVVFAGFCTLLVDTGVCFDENKPKNSTNPASATK